MKSIKNFKLKSYSSLLFSLIFVLGMQPEIFAQELTNLALNKASRQSSTSYDGPASFANDGNLNGDGTISHTKSIYGSWWEVDLGAEYEIVEVVIYNRTDSHTHRLGKFDIWVTNQPKGKITTRNVPFATELQNLENVRSRRYAKQTGGSSKGRYVRIELNYENNLHMAEVQVYGSKPNTGKWISKGNEKRVTYRYTKYNNGKNETDKVKREEIENITQGLNLNETAEKSHKKFWEMGIKTTASFNGIFVSASVETHASGGVENFGRTQVDKGKSKSESKTIKKFVEETVPALHTRYIFQKIVKDVVPYIYKKDNDIFSTVDIRQVDVSERTVFDLPIQIDPKYLEKNNINQIISQENYVQVWDWYRNVYLKNPGGSVSEVSNPIATNPKINTTTSNNNNSNVTYASCGNLTDGKLRKSLLSNDFEFGDSNGGYFTECQTTKGNLVWNSDTGESRILQPDFQNARLVSADGNDFKIVVQDGYLVGFEFMNNLYKTYD